MNSGIPQKRKRVLTAKQLRFIEEYQVDLNATQAAIRSGYSRRRAGEIGYQLLQKTTIQRAIAVKRKELSEQLGVTSEQIIREAARIAFSDVRELFDESGALRHIEEVNEDTAAAIASIQVVEVRGTTADKTHVSRYTEVHSDKRRLALRAAAARYGRDFKDLEECKRHLGRDRSGGSEQVPRAGAGVAR